MTGSEGSGVVRGYCLTSRRRGWGTSLIAGNSGEGVLVITVISGRTASHAERPLPPTASQNVSALASPAVVVVVMSPKVGCVSAGQSVYRNSGRGFSPLVGGMDIPQANC